MLEQNAVLLNILLQHKNFKRTIYSKSVLTIHYSSKVNAWLNAVL